MNQLGAAAPETGQFVDTMKSDLTIVLQELGILQEMLSYYEIPDSHNRIVNVWRLPHYLDDVLVIEDARRAVIDAAVNHAKNGDNVVILGAPGSGKTTVMYAIWRVNARLSNIMLFQKIRLYAPRCISFSWLGRPTEINKDIFDSLTSESLSIDGRQRENLVGHSNREKWYITRTKSRLIIGMAISGYSILVKHTKPTPYQGGLDAYQTKANSETLT